MLVLLEQNPSRVDVCPPVWPGLLRADRGLKGHVSTGLTWLRLPSLLFISALAAVLTPVTKLGNLPTKSTYLCFG